MMVKLIMFTVILTIVSGCSNGQEKMYANDIELYKNSPAWDLAQAVENQDTEKIKALGKSNPDLLKYHEKKFGQTLLEWAVYTDRYEATKALAETGADPNTQSYNGTSALLHAADKNNTSDYVKLLLQFGANVNQVAKPTNGKNQYLKTPLIAAARNRLETVKILVNSGSDINFYTDKIFRNALHAACLGNNIEIIRYLLIEKGADFRKPFMVNMDGDSLYLSNCLRNLRFELGSKEYETKMEVVEFLKERGMNYWETPIPKRFYDLYPKEYLEKY